MASMAALEEELRKLAKLPGASQLFAGSWRPVAVCAPRAARGDRSRFPLPTGTDAARASACTVSACGLVTKSADAAGHPTHCRCREQALR